MYRKEIFGERTLERLPELLPDDAENGLLVVGATSYKMSGAARRIREAVNIDLRQFVAPSPNPSLEDIHPGVDLVREECPDVVIGIGGGSVLDSAKALSVLPHQSGSPTEYIIGNKSPERVGTPLVAVPTTAGTGSETTHFATIYIDNEKYSLAGVTVYPTGAIVDPTLLESVPEAVRATAGIDALSQAIESYWSVDSTPVSRATAARAIELAWVNLEEEVTDPTDDSRRALARAAHLAGKSIDVSKTTACHSVSYPLTANFGVAHGAAVALTIPAFLRFNAKVSSNDCTDPRGSSFVSERLTELSGLLGANGPDEAAEIFTLLLSRINLPTTLVDFCVSDIEKIIQEGFTSNRIENNPRKINEDQLRELISSLR
jgi:alcohol dehydrogenase class IV